MALLPSKPCHRLADDGFDVAVAGSPRIPERLDAVVKAIQEKGRRAIAVTGDISLEPDVVALVEKTVQELGGVDVMVANAAIHGVASIVDLTVEDWDAHLAVNARGVMLCFKHAAREMIKRGRGGRIIGIGSVASKLGNLDSSAYVASKFAMRGLAQCAALELRKHNITANTVAPGAIVTNMSLHPDDEFNGGPLSTLFKNLNLPSDTPVGQPSEVAELVAYLSKPEAGFVTGQCIGINGGLVLD
ncbi:NAD(P)-binding protein [Ganoderma leucocontextum]|nr:NAD(P)-binding protein [Ganoderma leucocontextum]